ncbi:MAG: hypothetical protein R6X02_15910 [Enhygromyxa sp.]
MRAWLDHLPELRVVLQPGWYELPSHVEIVEVRRLLELLARGVPGVETVVECTWSELDEVVLGPAGLVFVSVPEAMTREATVERLKAHVVRLGIYQRAGFGYWPEAAWDETEVKRPLVASLRKSLRAAEHPLAHAGVGELPIELLAGATSEPVELLVLVENTLELALRQHQDQAVDWEGCAHQAIGQRLARRLAGVDDGLRGAVAACLASATDGTLTAVEHPREIEQLVRLGLAHTHEGDASLVPLARFGGEARVAEILAHQPATHATVTPTVVQTRARTPDEAFVTFDPRTTVQPGDRWFVDVGTHEPEVARVCRAVGLYLQRRDRGFLVEVACDPGSGARIMLRARLRELAADGLVTLTVDFPQDPLPIEVDISILLAMLRYYEAQPELVVADELLERIHERLARRVQAKPLKPSAIAQLLDAALANLDYEYDHDHTLHSCSLEMLAQLRRQLAARGQGLCLYIPRIDAIDRLPQLGEVRSHVHVLVNLPPASAGEQWGPDIVHLQYPTPLSPDTFRSILSARADLHAVFEDPEDAVSHLINLAKGNIGRALAIAHLACAWTSGSRVSTTDLTQACSRGERELLFLL